MNTPLGQVVRDGVIDDFLDGAGRRQFLLRRCLDCGAVGSPSEARCAQCGSWSTEHLAAAGGAQVVSWSVVHGRRDDGSSGPQAVVVIGQLDEGPWWWTQLFDAAPEELSTGRRLRIDYEPVEGGEVLPVFRLA